MAMNTSFSAASFMLRGSLAQRNIAAGKPPSPGPETFGNVLDKATLGGQANNLNLIPRSLGQNTGVSGGTQVSRPVTTGQMSAPKSVGTVKGEQLDFNKGTEVVSGAQKFILPVPRFKDGGEPLVYPKGATDKSGADLAGKPITDWQGQPIGEPGEKGVVFFNHKDQSWQAVKADGNGVIIMNQVDEKQGKALMDKVGKDPSNLSLQEFKGVLEHASGSPDSKDKPGLGLGDMYNSDRDFIKSKMNKLETADTGIPQYGLHRRDDRDVCHAVYVGGSGEFQGPAATPQKFSNGAVIVRQPDSKAEDGFSYRLVQPDAFKETYKNKDGSPIKIMKLSNQTPSGI